MNLIVSAITMVDLTNKEAKRVRFQSGKNLLTSKYNHLGKSVVMKSIFYTLGAEVFFPAPIKRLNLLTYIDFYLASHQYRVARFKNTFVLYCDNIFVGYYASVSAFEEKMSEVFNLEINLVSKDEDGTIVRCPPAYYYMPYYVDQENGWAVNSYSFDRMGQFDLDQRKSSYFFHLGVLDSSYVEIKKQHKTNDKKINQLTSEIEKYRTVVKTLQEGFDETQMSFDIESLEMAIASRQDAIRKLLNDIAKVRSDLLKTEDQVIQLKYEKEVLSKYIKKKVSVSQSSDRVVECPRCGMIFEQELSQQLEKMYLLETLHEDYAEISNKIVLFERMSNRHKRKFEEKQKKLADIENSLTYDRETYDAYLKSKATNQIVREYRNQIVAYSNQIEQLRAVNTDYNKQLLEYNKDRTTVNVAYLGKLRTLFAGLDIPLDQITEYSEPGSSLIASGAYGPRCKVAQILAFVETRSINAPDLITFPVVIDSPNVLEQDDEHLDSVIRTLLTWSKTDNQIIVASIQGKDVAEEIGGINIITLSNPKNHLFSAKEYVEYETEISEIFTQF